MSILCLVMFGVVLAADAIFSASICFDLCECKFDDMPPQNSPAQSLSCELFQTAGARFA